MVIHTVPNFNTNPFDTRKHCVAGVSLGQALLETPFAKASWTCVKMNICVPTFLS